MPKHRSPPTRRNDVRIIGGRWRGRRVHFVDRPNLRPTPDRVRETLFNWLRPSVAGTRCLDLYAGSGALGLEALSLAAASAVFVEQDAEAAAAIRANIARLGAQHAEVMEMGVDAFLAQPATPMDVVFIDPPYASGCIAPVCALLEDRGWVKSGSLVYIECERELEPLPLPPAWELVHSKIAGRVGYHLARRP